MLQKFEVEGNISVNSTLKVQEIEHIHTEHTKEATRLITSQTKTNEKWLAHITINQYMGIQTSDDR